MARRDITLISSFFLLLTAGVLSEVTKSAENTAASSAMDRRNFTISEEKRLTQYLLWKYSVAGRGGRPVVNTSQSTTVEFGLGLIQMDLDERNKVLVTSMWSRLKWRDVYMTWSPEDFGGITTVRLESHQVWIPDIMLYNTADPESGARNALVVVFYDGTVQWVPHQIFRSSCSINVTNFPFDEQTCHMWFGSWTYTLPDIDLKLIFEDGIDLTTFQSDYKDSCEWDIVKSEAERKLLPPDDPNPIAVLSFTLLLQRKLVFSSYILTLPCIILATLTLVVFWLPSDRPDRTSLAMNLLASFLVLLLILVEAAPPTASSVPLLGVYYCFNMIIITLSIFLSTMVVNISRAGQKGRPPPRWLRFVTLRLLARMVCIHPEGSCAGCGTCSRCSRRCRERRTRSDSPSGENDRKLAASEGQGLMQRRANDEPEQQRANVHDMVRELHRSLHELVRVISSEDERAEEKRRACAEWQDIARVLDRFFFCLYVAIVIGSLLTLSPRPPRTKFFWYTPR